MLFYCSLLSSPKVQALFLGCKHFYACKPAKRGSQGVEGRFPEHTQPLNSGGECVKREICGRMRGESASILTPLDCQDRST